VQIIPDYKSEKVTPFFPTLPFPPGFLLLRRPPYMQAGGLGSAVSFTGGVWGGFPAEIEFGAY